MLGFELEPDQARLIEVQALDEEDLAPEHWGESLLNIPPGQPSVGLSFQQGFFPL